MIFSTTASQSSYCLRYYGLLCSYLYKVNTVDVFRLLNLLLVFPSAANLSIRKSSYASLRGIAIYGTPYSYSSPWGMRSVSLKRR